PPYEAEPYDPHGGRRSALHPDPVDPPPSSAKSAPENTTVLRRTFFERRIGIVDLLVAVLLAALASAAVYFTQPGFGYTWDEALYYEPAQKSIEWARGVVEQKNSALLKPEAVQQHWGE